MFKECFFNELKKHLKGVKKRFFLFYFYLIRVKWLTLRSKTTHFIIVESLIINFQTPFFILRCFMDVSNLVMQRKTR